MITLQIRPKLLSPKNIALFLFLSALTFAFLSAILPDLLSPELYIIDPDLVVTSLVALSFVTLLFWSFFVAYLYKNLSHTIKIENDLLTFSRKKLFSRFTHVEKMISLKQLQSITETQIKTVVFTGKVFVPVTLYTLVFNIKDSLPQKLTQSPWSPENLKTLLSHLQKKYPQITIDTHLLRDSSEKISGLSEYKKSKNN